MQKQTRNPHTSIHVSFILFFFFILILPFLQQKFVFVKEYKLDENRVRKQFPHISSVLKFPSHIVDIEAYVKDSFGFRDTLIRIKNQIYLSLFHVSDKVYINPSGYLFSREFDNRYRAEIDAATTAHWEELFARMRYLQETLKHRGITLMLVPIPLADSIYPEHFSNVPSVGHGEKVYRKLYDFFDQNHIVYVDVIRELKLHKEEQIYYSTDIHYTQIGAFYVMKAMVNKLYKHMGKRIVWDYPLHYVSDPFSGELNKYLGAFSTYPDTNQTIERNWPKCSALDGDIWKTICPHKNVLPPTVIFGNSFMTLLLQYGLPDEFQTLHPYLIADLHTKLHALPRDTKIVVIEFYEIDVWNFLYGESFPEVGSLSIK